jgi:hypothetical protein
MIITHANLLEQGFIQDENFPAVYSLENSSLEFKLLDGILLAGLDCAGDEPQSFFYLNSSDDLKNFLKSVHFNLIEVEN